MVFSDIGATFVYFDINNLKKVKHELFDKFGYVQKVSCDPQVDKPTVKNFFDVPKVPVDGDGDSGPKSENRPKNPNGPEGLNDGPQKEGSDTLSTVLIIVTVVVSGLCPVLCICICICVMKKSKRNVAITQFTGPRATDIPPVSSKFNSYHFDKQP